MPDLQRLRAALLDPFGAAQLALHERARSRPLLAQWRHDGLVHETPDVRLRCVEGPEFLTLFLGECPLEERAEDRGRDLAPVTLRRKEQLVDLDCFEGERRGIAEEIA